MKKIIYLFLVVFSSGISSCIVEDETVCITTLDCGAGLVCIDGICVED